MTDTSISHAPLFGIAVFENLRETIASTPVARQLKMSHPDASVVWFTTERCAAVLERNPWIDEVIVLEGERDVLYTQVAGLRAGRAWTEFYMPSLSRNRERFPDAREWEVIQYGTDVQWVLPFVFEFHLSSAEVAVARRYWDRLPDGPKILVETEEGVSCPDWSAEWLWDLVDAFGDLDPTFVFVAEQPPTSFYQFKDRWPKAVWCREAFRLSAEFVNLCDVFVGVNGPVSAISYSTWCRRNVPHIECAPDERGGAAALRYPEDVWHCYDRSRYREALAAVAAELRGDLEPDFAPRFARDADPLICPACGKSVTDETRSGFLSCGDCNLLFAAQPVHPSQPDLPLSATAAAQRVAARVEHLRCALETWRGPLDRALLVEVGCCGTDLLRRARAQGLETIGLTDDAATLASPDSGSLGIRAGELPTAGIAPGSVAVLMLSHELPRHAHPVEYLELCQHLLEPGGIVYLTLPNIASIGQMTCGDDWPWLGSGRVACHPTIAYLRRAVAQLGLLVEAIETTTGEFDPHALRSTFDKIKPGLRDEFLPALIERCCQSGNGEELRVVVRKRGANKTRTSRAVDWGAATHRAEARRAARVASVSCPGSVP